VEYLLPVNPIQHYRARVDSNMVPVAEVPPQDIGPWKAALHHLLTDRAHFEDVSRRSRAAALAYANTLHAGWLEEHLENLSKRAQAPDRKPLTASRRRLLDLRVARARWFLRDETAANAANAVDTRLRLFYFPHAGGTAHTTWSKLLAPAIDVWGVRLPGREMRASETPFTEMKSLVEALTHAIAPHLKEPFAFYGHSMGAGVAFELTRELRRNRLPMPVKLIVSSARAPQLRTVIPSGPDPSDEDLLREVERVGGTDTDLLKLILPALRADTRIYRRYVYEPDSPLDVPIDAHMGVDDPSLEEEHMRAWREQTTAAFSMTLHAGGHFFAREWEAEWVEVLARALSAVTPWS